MFPGLASNDVMNLSSARRVLMSDLPETLPFVSQAADHKNLALGQLRPSAFLTAPDNVTTLLHLVSHVRVVIAKEQVSVVATGRVVTSVQHIHPVRDGSDKQGVGQPMRFPVLSGDAEIAVPLWVSVLRPVPALRRVIRSVERIQQAFGCPRLGSGHRVLSFAPFYPNPILKAG
jgi:hypothetical protein